MTLRAVYDTNVIVSAALTPGSVPASLVSLARKNLVPLCCSPVILAAYAEVLHRPKFELPQSAVDRQLADLRACAVIVMPTAAVTLSADASDHRFVECARDAQATHLVTGNQRHFPFAQFEATEIVSPAEFARTLVESALP